MILKSSKPDRRFKWLLIIFIIPSFWKVNVILFSTIIMSPLYRGGYILLYFSSLICLSDGFVSVSFVAVRSLCLSCRRSNTRRWPNAVLLAHSLRRWANISPVLGYRVMFDATRNVGQRHRRRANINPPIVQSIVLVLQPA